MITFPLDPVAKPRMTQRDKWKVRPAVARYRTYCDGLRMVAAAHRFTLPAAGARITFRIPMPRSWSKKKRAEMDGAPHTAKPDLDNLLKAVADALLPDDSGLWHLAGVEKRWAETGSVEVHVVSAVTE